MRGQDVLPELLRGKSAITVAKEMGRQRSFLSSYVAKHKVPGLVLMSEIADTLDYDLLLRNRQDGSEIIIDPPEKP